MRTPVALALAFASLSYASLALCDEPLAPAAPQAPPAGVASEAKKLEQAQVPAARSEASESSAPLPSEVLRSFRASALVYDDETKTVRFGMGGRELGADELYKVLNRPELVQEADRRATKRTWLFLGAGATAALGIGVGVAAIASAKDLNSADCVASPAAFNERCVPQRGRDQALGGVSIALGVILGSALAYAGFSIQTDPLSADEKQAAIAAYNGRLLGNLRQRVADAVVPRPNSFRLVPEIDATGGRLLAMARF